MEGVTQQRGILLVNLGSPKSLDISDVRGFLKEFLMDQYVLDYPKVLRWLIVHLFILPSRPKKSLKAYQSIWWKEGSPLIVLSQKLKEQLQRKVQFPVALSMRYGLPSIKNGITKLIDQGVSEILLISLYPHYSMSTTQTVNQEAQKIIKEIGGTTELKILPPYYQDPNYIEALVNSAQKDLNWDYDHILFSYHGIPERHLLKTDPTNSHCLSSENCCQVNSIAHTSCYRHQTITTTELFVKKVGIAKDNYSIAFQSRLGRDPWLQPYSALEIKELADKGVKKLLVICPSFVTDCLETLEEIGIAGKEIFLDAGGEEFRMIPCLNTNEVWLEALNSWSRTEFK